MQIQINGQMRDVSDGTTVAELLQELELTLPQVAVERNREVVPRAQHGETVLCDGDELEIVTLVGGG